MLCEGLDRLWLARRGWQRAVAGPWPAWRGCQQAEGTPGGAEGSLEVQYTTLQKNPTERTVFSAGLHSRHKQRAQGVSSAQGGSMHADW